MIGIATKAADQHFKTIESSKYGEACAGKAGLEEQTWMPWYVPDDHTHDNTHQADWKLTIWDSPHYKRDEEAEHEIHDTRPTWDLQQRHIEQAEYTKHCETIRYHNQPQWPGKISLTAIQHASARRVQTTQPDCWIVKTNQSMLAQDIDDKASRASITWPQSEAVKKCYAHKERGTWNWQSMCKGH